MHITHKNKKTIKNKSTIKGTKKMCSNIFTCKYPYICNLCYEEHKDKELNEIDFHEYLYNGKAIRCFNCNETTFYEGEQKVSRKFLKEIKKSKPEIYKSIKWDKCCYSLCGKNLPMFPTSSNSVNFEVCHKCLPNTKNLLINYFTETNKLLSTFGKCNTCNYEDGIYKMHKKCYDNFISSNK